MALAFHFSSNPLNQNRLKVVLFMASVKTAISLQKSLLTQVDTLAQELDISRSHLFTLAVDEFIQRHRNLKLLESINNIYDIPPDSEEQTLINKMRKKHKQMVDKQW
jgi:metal-responsive CopG/Arc/MetJ family transcriptional regulator